MLEATQRTPTQIWWWHVAHCGSCFMDVTVRGDTEHQHRSGGNTEDTNIDLVVTLVCGT